MAGPAYITGRGLMLHSGDAVQLKRGDELYAGTLFHLNGLNYVCLRNLTKGSIIQCPNCANKTDVRSKDTVIIHKKDVTRTYQVTL